MARKKDGGINTNLIIIGAIAIGAVLFLPVILKSVNGGMKGKTGGKGGGMKRPHAGGGMRKPWGGRPVKQAKAVYDFDDYGESEY